jgi:hypothetical protein
MSFAYHSWKEDLRLVDGTDRDVANADFIAGGLRLSYHRFFRGSWGYAVDVALASGQANAGGTQTNLAYQRANVNWAGVHSSARVAFRLHETVSAGMGPLVVARSIDWPVDAGTTLRVESGEQVNVGFLGELRIQLADRWVLSQSLGSLGSKGLTFWSLAFGYIL